MTFTRVLTSSAVVLSLSLLAGRVFSTDNPAPATTTRSLVVPINRDKADPSAPIGFSVIVMNQSGVTTTGKPGLGGNTLQLVFAGASMPPFLEVSYSIAIGAFMSTYSNPVYIDAQSKVVDSKGNPVIAPLPSADIRYKSGDCVTGAPCISNNGGHSTPGVMNFNPAADSMCECISIRNGYDSDIPAPGSNPPAASGGPSFPGGGSTSGGSSPGSGPTAGLPQPPPSPNPLTTLTVTVNLNDAMKKDRTFSSPEDFWCGFSMGLCGQGDVNNTSEPLRLGANSNQLAFDIDFTGVTPAPHYQACVYCVPHKYDRVSSPASCLNQETGCQITVNAPSSKSQTTASATAHDPLQVGALRVAEPGLGDPLNLLVPSNAVWSVATELSAAYFQKSDPTRAGMFRMMNACFNSKAMGYSGAQIASAMQGFPFGSQTLDYFVNQVRKEVATSNFGPIDKLPAKQAARVNAWLNRPITDDERAGIAPFACDFTYTNLQLGNTLSAVGATAVDVVSNGLAFAGFVRVVQLMAAAIGAAKAANAGLFLAGAYAAINSGWQCARGVLANDPSAIDRAKKYRACGDATASGLLLLYVRYRGSPADAQTQQQMKTVCEGMGDDIGKSIDPAAAAAQNPTASTVGQAPGAGFVNLGLLADVAYSLADITAKLGNALQKIGKYDPKLIETQTMEDCFPKSIWNHPDFAATKSVFRNNYDAFLLFCEKVTGLRFDEGGTTPAGRDAIIKALGGTPEPEIPAGNVSETQLQSDLAKGPVLGGVTIKMEGARSGGHAVVVNQALKFNRPVLGGTYWLYLVTETNSPVPRLCTFDYLKGLNLNYRNWGTLAADATQAIPLIKARLRWMQPTADQYAWFKAYTTGGNRTDTLTVDQDWVLSYMYYFPDYVPPKN